MNEAEREAIRERCAKAYGGPWEIKEGSFHRAISGNDKHGQKLCVVCERTGVSEYRNANFIAHSRTDIPMLLDEVETLVAERNRLQVRCEALERAIKQEIDNPCELCVYNRTGMGSGMMCEVCAEEDLFHWKFDEEKYMEGESDE